MKTVLAFGDSLTWGFEAGTFKRHGFESRWPNALAAALNGKARVIEEGLNGRTTTYPDHTVPVERNGAIALPMLLATHHPLDLLIIMLGTNDLKFREKGAAFHASLGIENLVYLTKSHEYNPGYAAPEILIVSPPHLRETENEFFDELWGSRIEESKLLAKHYKRVADENKCHFFDAQTVAKSTPVDGGHLDAENTKRLGQSLAPIVKSILKL